MITSNVYHRIFQVKFGEGTGTMFAIDVDSKQYLITARHVLGNDNNDASNAQVFFMGEWVDINLKVVGLNDVADVAVLVTDCQISPAHAMEATNMGIVWGQDVYFLGFPYGWRADAKGDFNRGFPMPFVKKALLSAMNSDNGFEQLFLDGHNNPGFSGGPVVFKSFGSNEFRVAGIISSYRYTEEPVFANGDAIPLVYRYNTGIILAHSITIATDLIASNPIGLPVNEN